MDLNVNALRRIETSHWSRLAVLVIAERLIQSALMCNFLYTYHRHFEAKVK